MVRVKFMVGRMDMGPILLLLRTQGTGRTHRVAGEGFVSLVWASEAGAGGWGPFCTIWMGPHPSLIPYASLASIFQSHPNTWVGQVVDGGESGAASCGGQLWARRQAPGFKSCLLFTG